MTQTPTSSPSESLSAEHAHGGTTRVESEHGSGTNFTVVLPTAADPPDQRSISMVISVAGDEVLALYGASSSQTVAATGSAPPVIPNNLHMWASPPGVHLGQYSGTCGPWMTPTRA